MQKVPEIRPDELASYPDLRGRVAFVTGGSRGIGAASCIALAANGVKVAVADLDDGAMDTVVARISDDGGDAIGVCCDITSREDLARARGEVESTLGRTEIVFAFAGGFTQYTSFHELPDEQWQAVVDLNLSGCYRTVREFLPGMIELGRGAVVTMGSSSARYLDELVTAPYAAAKAGVAMMTRHLALEAGQFGIRANCVCPATTRSERVDSIITPERQRYLSDLSPLGRMGYPIDVANAALYLASDASSWVTGVCLDVAGGRVML